MLAQLALADGPSERGWRPVARLRRSPPVHIDARRECTGHKCPLLLGIVQEDLGFDPWVGARNTFTERELGTPPS